MSTEALLKSDHQVSFVQDVHDACDKYKGKRVEGEALGNFDEAPESDDIEIWEVVSVDVDHNQKEKIKSPTNLPTDENEHHDLGTIPIQSTPLMPASSSAKKNLGQEFEKPAAPSTSIGAGDNKGATLRSSDEKK